MPQKPVVQGKKIQKKTAANKHGKGDRVGSRKGAGWLAGWLAGARVNWHPPAAACACCLHQLLVGKLEKPPKQARLLKQYKDNQVRAVLANGELARCHVCVWYVLERTRQHRSTPPQELTKMINANNEATVAGKAENAGGKLKAVCARPTACNLCCVTMPQQP
jgi:ferredoxin